MKKEYDSEVDSVLERFNNIQVGFDVQEIGKNEE